ncbi:MAG: DHH family phosphoesterase [Candidatus Omnitrophica bacterium]|nr:DHH family phosphoesterase [Candidatus Omnitrophota bacterium]
MQSMWRVAPADPDRAAALARAVRVHPVTAQLLLNRGVSDASTARRFLHPTLATLTAPEELLDLARAVARLQRAIAAREPILLFGDSDVDGLTAGVILYEVLRNRGAVVRAVQSNRITDGYGVPADLVERVCGSSTTLVVLMDCGTNQAADVQRLADAGIDTIIVDHHLPLAQPATPYALINPRCTQSAGSELCSAGLALKIAQAFEGTDGVMRSLDLAALGTLADCASLVGDNRVIVTEGLPRIVQSHREGLRRLCEATGTSKPEPEHVLRKLTPRLNASGRLGDAAAIWGLLLSECDGRIEEWLALAASAHATTKELHRHTLAEAQEQVSRLHFKDQFVLVVSRSGWHQGLMGPVASQLAQRYGRPAIAIAMDEHQGTGSGRSVALFNLLDVLKTCGDLLVRYGGHAQACGLTVDRKQLEPFRLLVNEQAKRVAGQGGLQQVRRADLTLALRDVTPDWVTQLGGFGPFGMGNPRPMALIRDVAIETQSPRMGVLSDGATRVAARGSLSGYSSAGRYDVVASPAVVDGELTLAVGDVMDAAEPSAPGLT